MDPTMPTTAPNEHNLPRLIELSKLVTEFAYTASPLVAEIDPNDLAIRDLLAGLHHRLLVVLGPLMREADDVWLAGCQARERERRKERRKQARRAATRELRKQSETSGNGDA